MAGHPSSISEKGCILVNLGQFKVEMPRFLGKKTSRKIRKKAMCSSTTSNKCLNKSTGRSLTKPEFLPY